MSKITQRNRKQIESANSKIVTMATNMGTNSQAYQTYVSQLMGGDMQEGKKPYVVMRTKTRGGVTVTVPQITYRDNSAQIARAINRKDSYKDLYTQAKEIYKADASYHIDKKAMRKAGYTPKQIRDAEKQAVKNIIEDYAGIQGQLSNMVNQWYSLTSAQQHQDLPEELERLKKSINDMGEVLDASKYLKKVLPKLREELDQSNRVYDYEDIEDILI